ncbi:Rib/alpha-like repeat protein, partial [[Eubacterium] yurii subsp. margaretiae ATCC 43715]
TVKNLTVNEDLTIDKQVGDSNVTLENMEIKGNLLIQGGGANTVHLKDVKVNGRTIIEKIGGQKPRVSVEGQSQLEGKVEIKQVAMLQTTDNVKIENVEIVKALNSNEEIQIRANIGKLDIASENANIKIEKGSKIKQIVLPSEVGQYKQGQSKYEKGNFKLVIENPSDVESGTNNKAGEFKFLTNKEISELDNKIYKDGEYFGDGFGFVEAKPIPVKVTVSGGKVTDISVVQEELNKIKNVAHPGEIDDGPAFSHRFGYVSQIVTRDQKPMATAYRLEVIRDAMNKVLSEAKSKDSVDDYNKALDKVMGKHVFSGRKLNSSSIGKIHAEVLSLIRTYVIDELGYDRKEYDAISGATFTGIGTSQAIANALRKADDNIGFYDMRVQDGYAEKFVEDKPLDLSSLKVVFYDKGKTSPRVVEYKDFAKNGLKVLFRDTNKEVKDGMILNKENLGYPISNGLTLKVVHEKSNTTKLLRGMSISKNAVLLKIDKLQVKAKDSNTWLDTTGFDSTVKKGEITYIQHLTLTKEQSDQLLNKEMEFRLITKRADNNQEVVLTTKTVSKYIWNKQTDESFKFHINRDSLKDPQGTKFKVDEIDSDYFVIYFKGKFGGKSIAETYTEEPNPITVTTGTILSENILASAFEDLPTDSRIKYNQVEANNLTSSVGDNKKLSVTVEFSDKSTKNYQLTINVKDKSSLTLAEQYNERPRRITVKVTTNPQLTDEMIRKALPNLPNNTKIELSSVLDFSKVGETKVTVNLTFSDDSKKQVEIPIIVRAGEATLADDFAETENITEIDVVMEVDDSTWKNNQTVKKIMELGGFNEKNIEAHIKALSHKARFGQYGHIAIDPIQTPDMTTVGKSKGRVKLTFKDNSEYEFDIDVNVKPLPMVYFRVNRVPIKTIYNISDTLDFDGLRLLSSLPNNKDGDNNWESSGPGAYILYDDFKYFGLKVVKSGTNEEVKQGDTVKSALTNGELKLSVISQYGIISTDENHNKPQEIKGLVVNKISDSFNTSEYATKVIDVETLVKPDKYKNLKVYDKKGFDSSLKTALREIESKYGEVTVEKVNEPDLTQLRDTTAKIKLKFKDDSVSNEI